MKYLRPALWVVLAAAVSCTSDMNEVDVQHIPAVNGTKLAPLTDESGATRAYIGTEVSVEGFNLDQVTRVTFDELSAEITEQSIKTLKFRVPALELAQRDNPWPIDLNIYDNNGEVIFKTLYFVTKPVTDAIVSGYDPAEGTLGTEITVSGRNLQQVTRVQFGAATVEASAFTAVAEDGANFKFLVPAGDYAAGDSSVTIAAVWSEGTLDVTGDTPFTLHTPAFDAVTQTGVSIIGDEIVLTGKNLELVKQLFWGTFELLIVDQSADKLTVRIPSSVAADGETEAAAALTARWGEPEQTTTIVDGWKIDRTPLGPAAPVVSSMTAQDGGEANKFYLGKVVTVKGENLSTVEGFTVDGVPAELSGEPTELEAKFVVPAGVTFTEATEVEIKAIYNDGEAVDAGTATVYPFYYYPNVTIGAQDESNRDKAFFVPAWGRVISTDEFGSTLDPYISATTQSAANTLNKSVVTSAAQYHEVPAYIFITNSSANVLSIISPSNSASQIRNHRMSDNTQLASGYGTPVIGYRNIEFTDANAAEQATAEKAHAGTLSSVSDLLPKIVSSGAPQFDNAGTANNRFKNGQVIIVQHMSYAAGKFSSMALSDVYDGGLMIIKEMTGVDGATGSNAATITFDFYWTKPQLEE